jgi:DNA-binding response OmpR family regulator
MINKIAIVDDNQGTGQFLESILSQKGFTVERLCGGKKIIEGAFSIPDIFFIEHRLSTIDGIALCKFLKIKDGTKAVPVIIITDDNAVDGKALRAGASCVLTKPMKVYEILECIESIERNESMIHDNS